MISGFFFRLCLSQQTSTQDENVRPVLKSVKHNRANTHTNRFYCFSSFTIIPSSIKYFLQRWSRPGNSLDGHRSQSLVNSSSHCSQSDVVEMCCSTNEIPLIIPLIHTINRHWSLLSISKSGAVPLFKFCFILQWFLGSVWSLEDFFFGITQTDLNIFLNIHTFLSPA